MHAGVFLTCGQKPERSEEEAPGSELYVVVLGQTDRKP